MLTETQRSFAVDVGKWAAILIASVLASALVAIVLGVAAVDPTGVAYGSGVFFGLTFATAYFYTYGIQRIASGGSA